MFKKIIVSATIVSGFFFTSTLHAQGCSTNTILGAIVGGALGHQVGKGKGNDAMTAVGAILGGSIANDSCKDTQQVQQQVQQQSSYYSEQQSGYYSEHQVYSQQYAYPQRDFYTPNCQTVSRVFHDGYGGYMTQWQTICQ